MQRKLVLCYQKFAAMIRNLEKSAIFFFLFRAEDIKRVRHTSRIGAKISQLILVDKRTSLKKYLETFRKGKSTQSRLKKSIKN
jgi:Holliday junction resolvasome RuvABC DNA-binding subunit